MPILTVFELVSGNYFRFVYCDRTIFLVDRAGTEIWATWPGNSTLEDTATYLLGPVLGFLLHLRGITCLHASAIAVDGQAVALLGPPGAGKSTTAAAFALQGHAVLSDDLVALDDRGCEFLVQPGHPRLCLWPDAVGVLRMSLEALPPLTPSWEKRYLDLTGNGFRFQSSPLPLVAIYILADHSAEPGAPWVESVSPATGLMELVANTYASYLFDREMRASEFELLARVATNVPVRRVHPHNDPRRLVRLCETILEDFHTLTETCSSAIEQSNV